MSQNTTTTWQLNVEAAHEQNAHEAAMFRFLRDRALSTSSSIDGLHSWWLPAFLLRRPATTFAQAVTMAMIDHAQRQKDTP